MLTELVMMKLKGDLPALQSEFLSKTSKASYAKRRVFEFVNDEQQNMESE